MKFSESLNYTSAHLQKFFESSTVEILLQNNHLKKEGLTCQGNAMFLKTQYTLVRVAYKRHEKEGFC